MKLVRAKEGYRKVGDKYLLAKKCTTCGRWLVASTVNFHRGKKDKYGLKSECKECRKNKNNTVNTNPNITKVCTTCGREFPATLEYFHKNKDCKYGLASKCKECVVEYTRQWGKNNKDKVVEYKRQWNKDNPDKVAEYSRQYYEDNKDKVLEKSRQYYQEHKDEISEKRRQWREDNSDKVAEYNRRRSKKRRQARIDAIIAQKRAEYEAERAPLVDKKTCKCCGRTLPASEFYVNKKSKDHLQSYCKECNNKKRMEKYYHDLETKGWA